MHIFTDYQGKVHDPYAEQGNGTTRYLAGFLMKDLLLKHWGTYELSESPWESELIQFAKDSTPSLVEAEMEDHYPSHEIMLYISETIMINGGMCGDIVEFIGIANDLFVGRRTIKVVEEKYFITEQYDPFMAWPLPCPGPPYGRRPYLQGQDPPRSQAVIWVPFPILRFAFFAKEVALFGRPFEAMQRVAQEQLEQLDSRLIHPEYFFILARVLELEDTPESRNSLDILANNLFLGEKPLTQAWVEGPQEAPWLR
ncbi:hypothetical protein [Holospora curviuscula]|uniref:Uncharacterized protein n=1 Tax=Holospora curviuscula TaxID=1082868 RepID=A0A2S5RDM8_9PROT|nr:hypothetical protein [Holospora curviuscula]PPE05312.1 hypothetical protein HCUR_00338 [Holospora curviuscula]